MSSFKTHEKNLSRILFIGLLIFMALCSLATATVIEVQNSRAGNFLPRDTQAIIDRGGNPKWRRGAPWMAYHWVLAEEYGEEFQGLTHEQMRNPELIEMTVEQRQRAETMAQEIAAKLTLNTLVSSVGCMQYPLCLIGIIMSFFLIKRQRQMNQSVSRIGVACLASFVIGWGFAFFRGYLSSLGI